MEAWEALSREETAASWHRFHRDFSFRPSVDARDWPGIREPADSITFAIGDVYGDAKRYEELTNDLGDKMINAFRACVPHGESVYALDWQHPCYLFRPHTSFDFETEADWPVPALPNGDYYIFLATDFTFGAFGHPWERTMCVFGRALIDSFESDPPKLFAKPIRVAGVTV